jgi:outer membrane immunogenic protein
MWDAMLDRSSSRSGCIEDSMNGSAIARASHSRRLLPVVGLTALTIAFATSASAADFAQRFKAPPPPAAPIYSWTGLYLGGQVGLASGRDDLFEYFTANGAFTGFEQHYKASGATGGVFGGGNYQFGNIVIGLEADIEASDIRGRWIDTGTGGAGTTRIGWQSSVRGRAGFVYDQAFIYGTGGVAFGDVSHTYTNLLTGVAETTSSVRTGWTAGAGIEVAIAPNMTARVDYRYTDYGMSTYSSVTSFPGLTGTQNAKLNTIRLGAAYKF